MAHALLGHTGGAWRSVGRVARAVRGVVRINKINFEVAKCGASYCQISLVPRVCDTLITLHTSNRLRTERGRLTQYSH